MSSTVSKSPKPDNHIPSRKERDDSFSTGAGRKAVEKPQQELNAEDRAEARAQDEEFRSGTKEKKIEAPIGLDNETRGDADA